MIIEKTIGGTLYQNNSKTKKIWLCTSQNRTFAVWDDSNKEKTLKRYNDKLQAIPYVTYLVQGE